MTETWCWNCDARARLSANSCLTARKIKALKGDFTSYCFVYKMVYCSVACCTDGNHNRQDLSYFVFPSDARLKKWLKFCRRGDKSNWSYESEGGKPNNLRICSAHFVLESYKRTLNGRRKILESALPTIFKPSKKKVQEMFATNQWERNAGWTTISKHLSRAFVWTSIKKIILWRAVELVVAWGGANAQDIQHDHSYCFVAKNDETDRALISGLKDTKPKKVISVSCQTDITMCCIEELEEQLKKPQN